MSWDHYHVWRSDWDQYIAALPKPSDGFATPAEKTAVRSYSAARLEFEKPYLGYKLGPGIQAYLANKWCELGTTP